MFGCGDRERKVIAVLQVFWDVTSYWLVNICHPTRRTVSGDLNLQQPLFGYFKYNQNKRLYRKSICIHFAIDGNLTLFIWSLEEPSRLIQPSFWDTLTPASVYIQFLAAKTRALGQQWMGHDYHPWHHLHQGFSKTLSRHRLQSQTFANESWTPKRSQSCCFIR